MFRKRTISHVNHWPWDKFLLGKNVSVHVVLEPVGNYKQDVGENLYSYCFYVRVTIFDSSKAKRNTFTTILNSKVIFFMVA